MAAIEFKEIKEHEASNLKAAFEYISQSKITGNFNKPDLANILGAKAESYFINPTKEEADEMIKQCVIPPKNKGVYK